MANDYDKLIVTDEKSENRIKDGIEKYRKGDFKVRLQDKNGVTCANMPVHVNLKNHKFRFGANIFMLDEIPDDSKKNEVYKEKFRELFNMATLPFYWDSTEPEEGKTRYVKGSPRLYRRPPIDLCMEFCEKYGIEPREHALCYEHFFPKWMNNMSEKEAWVHLERRMKEISERYADKIHTIEVTNEMQWGVGTKLYNSPDYGVNCYKLAAKYFPNNELCINEIVGIWQDAGLPVDWYRLYIENLLLKDARIDAIGLQYHMFHKADKYFEDTRRFYNTEHLFRILDNYAFFKKPLEITEITVPAYTEETDKEEEQADIIEKLYSVWFSHENVSQIIYWNLADGYAAFTEPGNMAGGENYFRGGLLRFDMSEKPAYKRIKKLIKETWHTELDLVTDENGEITFRGFYGEYELTLNAICGVKVIDVILNEDGKKEVSL